MAGLSFQYDYLSDFLSEAEIFMMQDEIDICHSLLVEKAGKGNEFLGWIDLPIHIEDSLVNKIKSDANLLRTKAEIVVVIGIGGSYLGARAVIEALTDPLRVFDSENKDPVVIYAGQHISQDYHASLLNLLDAREYALIVISKSGTTTEPAIAFRLLKRHLEKKYGKAEAATRIITVTDGTKGVLRNFSDKNGYQSYVIPDDIGGRFSVFTPAGLLPIAVAGFDIDALICGAAEMRKRCTATSSLSDNPAAFYAAVRSSLYRIGYQIELLASYDPSLHYVGEWWKQLFAESEGKENEGLFPVTVDFTGDLHTLGQYIQEGQRLFFETVVHVAKPNRGLIIPWDEFDMDGLNYLAGRSLHEVNDAASLAVTLAHVDARVPNLDIVIPEITEHSLGELLYFFQFACALSGYLLGINPFNQPGVEAYKNIMFALLSKPGYDAEAVKIEERFNERLPGN